MFRIALVTLVCSLASVAHAQVKSPSAEHLKVLAPIIGKSEGTWTDGTMTVKGTREVKWGADHGFITMEFEWHPPADLLPELPNTLHVTSILGWDAANQKVSSTSHSNWGIIIQGTYRVDGDKLIGEETVTNADGATEVRKVTMVINADGTQRVESTKDDSKHVSEWAK